MNRIIGLFLILICFSCKKENHTVESIFLENLKESTEEYQKEIKDASNAINFRYKETKQSYFNVQNEKLNFCKAEIEKSNIQWNSMGNSEIIESHKNLIKKLNSIDLGIKFQIVENEKIITLPKQILIEYLRVRIYKTLLNNYIHSLRNNVPFCGYVKYTKKGIKVEMEELKKEYEEMKKMFENPNVK